MKKTFKKHIIPFICIISLLAPSLLLTSCGSTGNDVDYKAVMVELFRNFAKADPTGAQQSNGSRLDKRKELYINQLDKLLAQNHLEPTDYEAYKGNVEHNIQNLKDVFGGGDLNAEVDLSIFDNIIWALSPNTLMQLYQDASILNNIINKNTNYNSAEEPIGYEFCFTTGQAYTIDTKSSYPLNSYISNNYSSNLGSFCSLFKKALSNTKIELNNEKYNIIKPLNFNEGDALYKPHYNQNQNSQNTDIDSNSLENNNVSFEKIGGKEISINKNNGSFTISYTASATSTSDIGDARTKAEKKIEDAKWDEGPVKKYLININKNIADAGRSGFVYAYKTIKEEIRQRQGEENNTTYTVMITTTITGGLSEVIRYNKNIVKEAAGALGSLFLPLMPDYEYQFNLGNSITNGVDFLVEDSQIFGTTTVSKISNRNNNIFGYPTFNASLTDTGSYNTNINTLTFEFNYNNSTSTTLEDLYDLVDSYNQYKAANNKNKAGEYGYKILNNSNFFTTSGNPIETGNLTKPTSAAKYIDNINYTKIFDSLCRGETNDINQLGTDFVVYFANVPICAIRLNELTGDSVEKMDDAKNEWEQKGYVKVLYKQNDKSDVSEVMVKQFANIDVIDHISGEGFTVKKSQLLFDIFDGAIKKVNENETDNAFADAIDGLGENQSSLRKEVSKVYPLNMAFWKAPPGEILLIKYYPLYDDTETNSPLPIPLGRPLYLNTDNITFEAAEEWYRWKDKGKPAFILSDPTSEDGARIKQWSKYGLMLGAIKDKNGATIDGYNITDTQYNATIDQDLGANGQEVLNNAFRLD